MHFSMKLASTTVVVAAFAVAAVACSASVDQIAEGPSETEEVTPASAQPRPDELILIKSPVSPDGLQVIFGTPDLGVGEQRVGVVLISKTGLVRSPIATMSTFYLPGEGSEGELRETVLGLFRPFPLNTRGIYTANLSFDKPGRWGLEISVLDEKTWRERRRKKNVY